MSEYSEREAESKDAFKSEDTKECPWTSRKSGKENMKNEVVRQRI